MLGYMTAAEAKETGFTHHGSYYGIPCWLRLDDMMVATKWAPLEHLMTVFHLIEGLMYMWFFPHEEPSFRFLVGDPIDKLTVGDLFD